MTHDGVCDAITGNEDLKANRDDEAAYIAGVLGSIARVRGIAQLAKSTGIALELLDEALSRDGNPSLETVLKVLKALGSRLTTKVA